MNQKEILLTEMLKKVGDRISEEIVAEKVDQFIKYGNVFLFFELIPQDKHEVLSFQLYLSSKKRMKIMRLERL